MTNKNEIITAIKLENPSLRVGSDEAGYVNLTTEEYEALVEQWAEHLVTVTQEKEAAIEKQAARQSAYVKLGLTPEEIEALGN